MNPNNASEIPEQINKNEVNIDPYATLTEQMHITP